jgi:hypothetical protein
LFHPIKLKTMGKNVHVVPKGNSWAVKTEKSERALRITETQKEAVGNAQDLAKKQQSELIIHRTTGEIRQKDSYGNDSYPPVG